ncbi:hypothetical protein HOLleu_11329 [Holothuria leucospilota]|uniref:Uncharacterized protein n=1 Tax=Holothuria leucospilota TaxID=206669 RepID=A0A9Q1HFH8_HOLLE|nr:hypothetical protein HOLleu_11329 [Holothuria leucospilota]
MPIGVVAYLSILQGATYLYEFLFGKIQPRTQESDASSSSEDDNTSEELVNLTSNQRRRRHGEERCKAVAAGLSSFESELGEETSQDSATGLANVTTGASSSSDPVDETGRTSTAGETSKHQVPSEGKDQPQRNSPQKEQGQTSEADACKTGGNKTESNKSHPDRAEDSVPAALEKEEAKKLTSHEDQSPPGKAGTSKGKESFKPGSSDCSQEIVPTTSRKEQPKGASTQKEQESDASSSSGDDNTSKELVNLTTNQRSRRHGEERCKAVAAGLSSLESELGEETSQDSATGLANVTTGASSSSDPVDETGRTSTAGETSKHQVPSEGKDQPQRNSPQKEQGQTSEADACKTGGNKTESNKTHPDCAEDSVPATPEKEEAKKLTSHEDQSPPGKAGTSKEKESIKPGSSDCSQEIVPTTSRKEQPKGASTQKEQGTTCECIVGKKETTAGEPKKPICDKVIQALSTASSREHPKSTLAQKDQGTTSEDVKSKIRCKGKEQEPSEEDQGPTSLVADGKVEDKEKELGKPNLSDKAENSFQATTSKGQTKQISGEEENTPTSSGSFADFTKTDCSAISNKEQVKNKSTQEDKSTVCDGKISQNTCSTNVAETVSSASCQEKSKKQLVLQDQRAIHVVGNEKGLKRSSSDTAEDNNPITPGEKQTQGGPAPKHLGPINEADADKKSKVNEPKPIGQGSVSDEKDASTASSKESNNAPAQKNQIPVCKYDDGTKGYFTLESKEDEIMGPSDDNQEGPKNSASGKRYSLMRHPRNMENGMMGSSDENREGSKKSGKRYSLMRHPRNMENGMMGSSDENREGSKKSASGKRYSLMRHPRSMENGMMEPSNEGQEGPKKSVSGKRYSLMRHPRNMVNIILQPFDELFHAKSLSCCTLQENGMMGPSDENQERPKKSGKRYSLMRHPRNMENGMMGPSDENQERPKKSGKRYSLMRHPRNMENGIMGPGEETQESPKKSANGKRYSLMRHPRNMGKPQLNAIATAEQAASSIPSQERNLTKKIESSTTEVTIGANKSKPNIATVPAHSENKTPESLDEKSQNNAKLVEAVTEMSPNAIVRNTRCITKHKKGLCVRQKFFTVLSTIVEETLAELANVATLNKESVTGTLQPSQGQPNNNFPITRERDVKDPVECDTKFSASCPAFGPREETLVIQTPSSGNRQTTPVTYMFDPASKAALMAASPVQRRTNNTIPTEQSRIQKSVTVRHQDDEPTTELPQMSTSSVAYNSYSATPVMQQQCNISTAVNCESTPVLYMYPEQLAASPVQQGTTDSMSTNQSRVQKSVPVRHQQEVRTTELPQMTTVSPAYTTYSTSLAMEQQGYIPLAVNLGSTPVLYMYPEQLADYLSKAASPVQQGPPDNMPTDQSRMQKSVPVRHQQEERHGNTTPDSSDQLETCLNGPPTLPSKNTSYQSDYRVRSTKNEMGYASIASNVITTCAPSQQQGVVEPHIHKTYPAVSLEVATTHKTHLTMRTPGLIQDVQRSPRVTSPKVVSTTKAPEESAVSSANCIPLAAAPYMKQHTNITPAVQVLQKKYQVTSQKVAPIIDAPETKVSLTASNIPKAIAPLKHQQSKTTLAVKETVLKKDQATFPKVVLVTNAREKKGSPTACTTPKAATPLKHQQSKTTLALKEEMQKKDQVTFSKVVPNTITPQEEAQSVSINKTKALVTINEQPNNACHSQSQISASSQAVRPKEKGPLAKAPSSSFVETSTAGQTGSTAKAKISKSTKRRRARARQRERQRGAEAEKRAAEAEKEEEAAEGAAAVTVKEAEGADSSYQGEVASSSSDEIILNFDDDSYYAIDWEAEAARPFYNSTAIFRPRVAIPDWAEWDFSQNERLRQLGRENPFI